MFSAETAAQINEILPFLRVYGILASAFLQKTDINSKAMFGQMIIILKRVYLAMRQTVNFRTMSTVYALSIMRRLKDEYTEQPNILINGHTLCIERPRQSPNASIQTRDQLDYRGYSRALQQIKPTYLNLNKILNKYARGNL